MQMSNILCSLPSPASLFLECRTSIHLLCCHSELPDYAFKENQAGEWGQELAPDGSLPFAACCFGLLKTLPRLLGYAAPSLKAMMKTTPHLSVSSLQHPPSNIISAHHRGAPMWELHVLSSHGPRTLNTGPAFHVSKAPRWHFQKPGTKKMHNK